MKTWYSTAVVCALLVIFSPGFAQKINDPIQLDATAPAVVPETGFLNMGGVSSNGHRIEVNSRYLTYDGKPWLPVMGEFHFARFPEQYWEEEILKMKAGGVQVIATYVFWIHHEEVEGQFDWSGQRDLRRFVSLCGRHGLYVYLRIGPWDHGEVRNGGFPDWLLAKKIPLRRNDPEYLKYVGRLYDQIGLQIQGQLWKDGGPILGVQLENEYGETGPGAGAEHLAALRKLAIDAGITPPLFSVTGWPGHDYPIHDVIPVAGGYPDDFWTGSQTDNPANPVYLFHPDRALGDMGAMALGDPAGKVNLRHYPYFGAEEGGGMETSYHRRPLIQPEDIAALTLTNLGSGVNLYGYYMFHGGANPKGKLSTLQESQETGYPNDLPVLSYDFQAPIGEYGQERESFNRIKLIHFFLSSYGGELAAMPVITPAVRPSGPGDASITRVALRARDARGFIFVNNYSRKLEMPARKGFQTVVRFSSGTIAIPRNPINLPANSSFMWPVNLDLGPATLRYSTAQLLTRLDGAAETTYFFFAVPGLSPEFVFDAGGGVAVHASNGKVVAESGTLSVTDLSPRRNCSIQVSEADKTARIILLTEKEAEQFWLIPGDSAGETAMLSEASVFINERQIHLRSTDPAKEHAFFYSPRERKLWKEFTFPTQPRSIRFELEKVHDAAPAGPIRMGPYVDFRKRAVPMAPGDAEFTQAAVWRLKIPKQSMEGLSDLFLRIHYVGDVGRLYRDNALLDDNFYNGSTWEVGLKRFLPESVESPIDLRVLPLRSDLPIYLDAKARAKLPAGDSVAAVEKAELLPEYEVILHLPESSSKNASAKEGLSSPGIDAAVEAKNVH